MITMPVELYTDGSCSRNPGPGGFAWVIRYWETPEGSDLPESKIVEGNKGFRLTTNNRMEIMGGIYGLKEIMSKVKDGLFSEITQINLTTDSEYFAKAINQGWINKWMQNDWMTSGFKGSQPKPVKNKDLWEQIINIQNEIKGSGINLTVTHVLGHNGHEFNERADKLAVAATMNSSEHTVDDVYEKTANLYNRN